MADPIQVLHISAECYPAAKSGGLADVVGALPKYLNKSGLQSDVIIPKYLLPWITGQDWQEEMKGSVYIGYYDQPYTIESIPPDVLGFRLYAIDIPWKFDRPGVYADPEGNFYQDEAERFICFQRCVLDWLVQRETKPDLIHCHDHHTGLAPFMIRCCPEFQALQHIPTAFTIHNGRYHGSFSWDKQYLLPYYESHHGGLLEWDGVVNPLATGIKCADRVTTVSRAYLEELRENSNGLETLLRQEWQKSIGILNGIDTAVWDPKTDASLAYQLKKSVPYYKRKNKAPLIEQFGLDKQLPLISFIGRFAIEKGADLLPQVVYDTLSNGLAANILILGSGDVALQNALNDMRAMFAGRYNTYIGYNEALAHQIYAGTDYLFMPSRVEPCGLNQMYAMRYGAVPIVRRTGGLNDSVVDIGDPKGSGIMFNYASLADVWHAFNRAVGLYDNRKVFEAVITNNMSLDYSWEKSASTYIEVYHSILS